MAFTPTDPLKAEVRVIGEAPNQSLDFYIPRGPKGESGGITLGTPLDNVTDTGVGRFNLNDVTTSGVYRMTATNDNLLIRNYPRNYDTGVLVVLERVPGQTITQVWHTINQTGRTVYERTYVTGTWSPWRAFNSTRVDQVAGRAIYQFDDVNGREQLIYGDTGERSLTADSLAPVAGWGAFRLRRNGQLVTLNIQGMDLTNVAFGGDILASIPAGFRPSVDTRFSFAAESSYATVRFIASTAGALQMAAKATGAVLYVSGTVTWVTNQVWPTTLPGVAVGTIPNI